MQDAHSTEGVIPSLHVYYKNTHLKQYHKTEQARCGPAYRNHHQQ